MMSFFQKWVCHRLIGNFLVGAPPCGGLKLGRMTGRKIIYNVFNIPDWQGSQNIPCLFMPVWGLSLIPAMETKAGHRSQPEYRSLSAPKPQRKIVAVWSRRRPPGRATQAFLKIAEHKPALGGYGAGGIFSGTL